MSRPLVQAHVRGQVDGRVADWVHAHFDFIWRLLRRLGLPPADADDAAQQVFMIALHKAGTVTEEKARSFLYGTALRVAANAKRKRGRLREVVEDPTTQASAQADAETRLEQREACDLLDEILEHLPDELRRALILAEIEGATVAEIAELESIPVGTVASRLRRAREVFRGHLRRLHERLAAEGSGS